MLTKTKTPFKLREGFIMRPGTLEDLETAVALFNICSQAQIGADEFSVDEYRTEWQAPGFDMANSTRAVIAPNGQMVGLIEVWDTSNPPVRNWVWGRVHPDYEGLGIGTTLMEWAEQRARQAISRVPDGIQVSIESSALSTHKPTKFLFMALDMEPTRHFWRMVIDLDKNSQIPQPQWPEGIVIRTYVDNPDLTAIYRAVDEAFMDHWGYVTQAEAEALKQWEHWVNSNKEFDPTLWFLAMHGDEIAAMSLCRPHITDDPQMGFVDTLGVLRSWRRQGLALALLHHSFAEFQKRGQLRVGLGVDAASLTGATRLYKKAGMHADRQHEDYTKILRSGKDISTQTLTNQVNP